MNVRVLSIAITVTDESGNRNNLLAGPPPKQEQVEIAKTAEMKSEIEPESVKEEPISKHVDSTTTNFTAEDLSDNTNTKASAEVDESNNLKAGPEPLEPITISAGEDRTDTIAPVLSKPGEPITASESKHPQNPALYEVAKISSSPSADTASEVNLVVSDSATLEEPVPLKSSVISRVLQGSEYDESRRLSSTPIEVVARIAGEVADTAAALDKEEVSLLTGLSVLIWRWLIISDRI
jgi:hypothetical protein